jgi:hypothetical protein
VKKLISENKNKINILTSFEGILNSSLCVYLSKPPFYKERKEKVEMTLIQANRHACAQKACKAISATIQ